MSREPAWAGMQVAEVLEVLADLCGAGCRIWVAGGWGVDALVGYQTRPHRDLDLAVDADHEAAAIATLERRGYHIETDWLPVRMELAAPDRGWVDLHPVVFDSSGHGRQADRNGGHFDYPSDAFDHGILGGMSTPCLSRTHQVQFHRGYEPRPVDIHDLGLLEQISR